MLFEEIRKGRLKVFPVVQINRLHVFLVSILAVGSSNRLLTNYLRAREMECLRDSRLLSGSSVNRCSWSSDEASACSETKRQFCHIANVLAPRACRQRTLSTAC